MSVADPQRTSHEPKKTGFSVNYVGLFARAGPIPDGSDPGDIASICDARGIELVAKARRRSPYPGQSAV